MTIHDIALEVYLKKIPTGHVNDSTRQAYESAAKQAYEVAAIFMQQMEEKKNGTTY